MGSLVGAIVGDFEGEVVGPLEGDVVGDWVGLLEGDVVGDLERDTNICAAKIEGIYSVGLRVGDMVGFLRKEEIKDSFPNLIEGHRIRDQGFTKESKSKVEFGNKMLRFLAFSTFSVTLSVSRLVF